MHGVNGNVFVELRDQHFRPLRKFYGIFGQPPRHEIPCGVILASLVVKTVRDFMPNCRSGDVTIRHSVVNLVVSKTRNHKNGGGQHNFVVRRIVISVICLRRHAPLCSVNGFSEFRRNVIIPPFISCYIIACKTRFIYQHRAKIFEFVGITDFFSYFLEFIKGFCFRRRTHPIKVLDVFSVSRFHVFHHFGIPIFSCFREKFFDKQRTQCVAQLTFEGI